MIKAIIFDLGGVVIDFTNDEHYYPYLSRASGKGFGRVKSVIENNTLWAQLDKDEITQGEFDTKIARRLGIHKNQVRWYEEYEKHGRVDRKVVGLAKRLKRFYVVAYLSNVDLSRYTWSVKLLKPYSKIFKYKFASCYIHRRKPAKEVYTYVLARMHLKPKEAVFIDNQIENVAGAASAGLHAIRFRNSRDLERRLKKLGMEV